ncbi:MAG: hypothetical protein GX446_17910 [Chthonomonadales bacterium]|nr:hypothetical protein [Chthonomonadales bacterium]
MRRWSWLTAATILALLACGPMGRADTGTVWGWGWNDYGHIGDASYDWRASPVKLIRPPEGIAAVSAGGVHTFAVKSDGTVLAWGANWNGQLGDGTNTDRLTPVPVSGLSGVPTGIAAPGHYSMALLAVRTMHRNGALAGEPGTWAIIASGASVCSPLPDTTRIEPTFRATVRSRCLLRLRAIFTLCCLAYAGSCRVSAWR